MSLMSIILKRMLFVLWPIFAALWMCKCSTSHLGYLCCRVMRRDRSTATVPSFDVDVAQTLGSDVETVYLQRIRHWTKEDSSRYWWMAECVKLSISPINFLRRAVSVIEEFWKPIKTRVCSKPNFAAPGNDIGRELRPTSMKGVTCGQ